MSLGTAVLAYSLMQSVTLPVLPQIQRSLGTDQVTAAWILSAFLLAASVATPIGGRIGDAFGKRLALLASLTLLCTGCLIASVANSIEVMIFARTIQGLGGGVLPLVYGILRDELPERRVTGAIGLASALTAVGFALGLVLAPALYEEFGSYHVLFLIPATVAGASAIGIRTLIAESRHKTRARIPIRSALLFSGGLVAALMAVSEAPDKGWGSAQVIGLIAIAGVALPAWMFCDLRSEGPMVDIRLMGARGIWAPNLVALLVGMTMYAFFAFLPQFTQTPVSAGYGFGATLTEAGRLMLPASIASFTCSLIATRVVQKIGVRPVACAACLIAALGLALITTWHDSEWQIYVAGILVGAGSGAVVATLVNSLVDAVPRNQTGVATGMNANIRTIGGAVGAALTATIVTLNVQDNGYPSESGYVSGFTFLAVAGVAAAFACLLIPGRKGAHHNVPPEATPTPPIVP